MRKINLHLASALALTLLSTLAFGEAFERKDLGVKVEIPEGWSRDHSTDGTSTVFSADADVAEGKSYRVTIEVQSVMEFDPEKWIEEQMKTVKEDLSTILNDFKLVRTRTFKGDGGEVGSHGYEISGMNDDEEQIRHRVAAVINGENVLIVHEIAKGDAEGAKPELGDKMMAGIQFPKPVFPPLDLSLPEGAKPELIEDKAGNFKVTLPPGWEAPNGVSEVEGAAIRFTAIRKNSEGREVAVVSFFRFANFPARIFAEEGPTQFMNDRTKPIMEDFFGHTNDLYFDSDESILCRASKRRPAGR